LTRHYLTKHIKRILFRMILSGEIVPKGLEKLLEKNAPHTYKILITEEAMDKWKELYEVIAGQPPVPPYPDEQHILEWYRKTLTRPPKKKIDLTSNGVRRYILGLSVKHCSRCKSTMDMCACCRDHGLTSINYTTTKPSLDDYDQNSYENTPEYWDTLFERIE